MDIDKKVRFTDVFPVQVCTKQVFNTDVCPMDIDDIQCADYRQFAHYIHSDPMIIDEHPNKVIIWSIQN